MQYKRNLGLYIKYIHTVKSASGTESSRVNMVWKNSEIGLSERELLDMIHLGQLSLLWDQKWVLAKQMC